VTRGSTITGRANDSHKHCNTRLARPLAPARGFHTSEIHSIEQDQKLMQDAYTCGLHKMMHSPVIGNFRAQKAGRKQDNCVYDTMAGTKMLD